MNKLMMSFAMVCVVGSLAACVESEDGLDEGALGEESAALKAANGADPSTTEVDLLTEEPGGTATALTVGGHYCVNQSFASAVSGGGCASSPPWNTSLSANHPVKVLANCGGTPYVVVQSLWNTALVYEMRADAFRPC